MLIYKVNDAKYLKWLRTRPCAYCGYIPPSEPHHVRGIDGTPGTGRKPSDHLALPACRQPNGKSCHDLEQQYVDIGEYDERLIRNLKLIVFHLSEYLEETKR